jgi:hypothetical protein
MSYECTAMADQMGNLFSELREEKDKAQDELSKQNNTP